MLLKDHFLSSMAGNVVVIHTLANEIKEVDAMARGLYSLLPIIQTREEKSPAANSLLCSQCQKNWETLEEQIREKVVNVGRYKLVTWRNYCNDDKVSLLRRHQNPGFSWNFKNWYDIQSGHKEMGESSVWREKESLEMKELLRKYDEDMLCTTTELEKSIIWETRKM